MKVYQPNYCLTELMLCFFKLFQFCDSFCQPHRNQFLDVIDDEIQPDRKQPHGSINHSYVITRGCCFAASLVETAISISLV